MNNILLVALREFRQIAMMKSFWLTLLLVPVALALGPIFGDALDEDEATRVAVIDRSQTTAGNAIVQRFDLEEDRALLQSLSRHVRRYELERADPQAVWTQHDRWYTDADVAIFREAGGLDAAVERIASVAPEGTPEFEAPSRDYDFVEVPESLAALEGQALAQEVDALLQTENGDGGETNPDVVLLLGESYPQDPTINLWSNEQPRASFMATLQDVLTTDLRQQLLSAQGIGAEQALAIQNAAPAIAVTTPAPGGGAREALFVRSIVPLALAYILMMSLMLSGSWMLQGSVEERSNKLLESLLACIRPEELMYGKLLGAVAVGLSMVLVWASCAAIATFAMQGAVADMIRPALAPLASPSVIVAALYFFIAGYVAISIIFVAIGALADSMSEAQGYLMPVMLGILLPMTFLIGAILAGTGGLFVQAMTWIPLWTPFTVLARLGSGIEIWELVGAAVLLAAFIVLEIVFLGRLFRASLLATGQKPGIKQLFNRVKSAG